MDEDEDDFEDEDEEDEETDDDAEEEEHPPTFPEMLKIAFEAKLATPEDFPVHPKWIAGGVFDAKDDFWSFIGSRSLHKNEGLVLRHLLRLALLAAEFFRHTGDPGYDEIAVEAVIPAPSGDPAGGYLKLERRVGDYATVGVAVAIERSGANVTRAGIALTAVGPSTIAADAAGQALVGRPLSAGTIGEAAELAAQAAQPKSDHRGSADFKRQVVRVFTTRILTALLRSAEEAA